jgi:hypothetical protein
MLLGTSFINSTLLWHKSTQNFIFVTISERWESAKESNFWFIQYRFGGYHEMPWKHRRETNNQERELHEAKLYHSQLG